MKFKNIYYFQSILAIGGIETFFYYLAKKYKDYDLAIVYKYCNEQQLERLKKYVKCIEYKSGMTFECEHAFFNFNTDIIDSIKAKEYYLVLHGDYKAMIDAGQLTKENLPGHPKITKYIGVSQLVCDTWKEITGKEAELCYNPFEPDNVEKEYIFISPTRLSIEKGGKRIIALSNELDKKKIKYTWYIYSNSNLPGLTSPNVKVLSPKLDIQNEIIKADFLIQLSDNEGYCYSVIEALTNNIPVIVTPVPVFKELKINEKNSIILNFDCSNLDEVINKIQTKKFNFTYKAPEDNWKQLLAPGESQYQKELNMMCVVSATSAYQIHHLEDKNLGRIPEAGDKWITTLDRALFLDGQNDFNKNFVSIVEKFPKEEIEKKKKQYNIK